jgi:F-type H+-transporting ATPase subunit delta
VQEIAEVYSRALFDAAKEDDVLDPVHDELNEFADALEDEGNRELRLFFYSPYFSSDEKKDGVEKVISDADERLRNFLQLLAERHRMPALPRIRRDFNSLWREEKQLLPVNVTSAIELDEQLVQGIGERIQEQTGREVELTSDVDPEVLGGLVLRVGNMVLDASIRARLDHIRKQIMKAA